MEIDVFWSFSSPWSYLATRRLRQMKDNHELTIRFSPVYPLAIRDPEFFHHLHPLQPDYFLLDLKRVADFQGLPLTWPSPDPVVQFRDEQGLLQSAAEQPYIHDLTRFGVIAAQQGKGIECADEISPMIWVGTVDWDKGKLLEKAVYRAGLDLKKIKSILRTQEGQLQADILDNQEAHTNAGHWGVPTGVYQGEPFFGQDRLDILLWRLKKDGLKTVN